MPGYKEKNKYRKKRSKVFTGIKKQDIQDGGPTTSTNPSICSPVKLNRSFEKIKANCPLLEAEKNQIVTRKRAFELGVNNDERTTAKAHSYKLMDANGRNTGYKRVLVKQQFVVSVRNQKALFSCGRMIIKELV